MAEIVIEKDVPIPVSIKNSLRYPHKYGVMGEMEVGDSFLLSGVSKAYAYNVVNRGKAITGYKFRQLPVEGGYRIWRVE